MSISSIDEHTFFCFLIGIHGACRVNFRLKSDTNLFEIAKCKTIVSVIEVQSIRMHSSWFFSGFYDYNSFVVYLCKLSIFYLFLILKEIAMNTVFYCCSGEPRW